LIAAVKNEVDNIEPWFESIWNQSRPPDEIIIVDETSTDGTREKLGKITTDSIIPVHILIAPDNSNIAKNRNIAIKQARSPVIAVTDFGCLPQHEWLENLIAPFEMDKEICVSAGIYDPVSSNKPYAKNKKLWLWSKFDRINPQNYLPPGGSTAFRKDAWQAVGGYPEWLTMTGEDTYFDLELKRLGGKWAFVPDAIVQWEAPDTLLTYLQKQFLWATGDGESGVYARYFWHYVLRLILWIVGTALLIASLMLALRMPAPQSWISIMLSTLAWMFAVWYSAHKNHLSIPLLMQKGVGDISQILGFIRGYRRREEVDRRRYSSTRGIFFVLSGVPIDDTGGGARGTQITFELLKRNYRVIYIYKFPKYESINLKLNISHPNLITYHISMFKFDLFASQYESLVQSKPIMAIIEHPISDFLPVIKNILDFNGIVAYDLIDDWDTSLGAQWYSPRREQEIIDMSKVIIATVPKLQKKLQAKSTQQVHLIPNAANIALFNPHRTYSRPLDMHISEWCGIYIGALWGDWFDWNLLRMLAIEYPKAAFHIIGDYKGQCRQPPPNLHFLGLKSQDKLPNYLRYSDVAIVPWKVSATTQATSPLKVFEYLAMQCPVVAPALHPLWGIPGVHLAQNNEEFISLVGKYHQFKIDRETISAFMIQNNWQIRVDQLLSFIKDAQLETP